MLRSRGKNMLRQDDMIDDNCQAVECEQVKYIKKEHLFCGGEIFELVPRGLEPIKYKCGKCSKIIISKNLESHSWEETKIKAPC